MFTTNRLHMMKRPTNSSRESQRRLLKGLLQGAQLFLPLMALQMPHRSASLPLNKIFTKTGLRFAGELSCFSSTEGWQWQGIWEEASSCQSWGARWRVWTSCQVGRRRCGVHCPRASRGPTDAWQAHTAPPSSYQPPFLLNLQIIFNSVFCFGAMPVATKFF